MLRLRYACKKIVGEQAPSPDMETYRGFWMPAEPDMETYRGSGRQRVMRAADSMRTRPTGEVVMLRR